MTKEAKSTNNSSLMLDVMNIDMDNLFVSPEKNETTKIAGYLAQCVVPVKAGVLKVPRKIIDVIEDASRSKESMLSLEAAEMYHMACQLHISMTSQAAKANIDDPVDAFTFEAVQASNILVHQFITAVQAFCRDIENVQKQVASEQSFYMVKALGTEVPIDGSLVVIAAQSLIHNLNAMASGLEGFKILSLVKLINAVGKLMGSEALKSFLGISNQAALVNKLGYKVLPSHVALHNQLDELVKLMMDIEDSSEPKKDSLVKIFTLSSTVYSHLAHV